MAITVGIWLQPLQGPFPGPSPGVASIGDWTAGPAASPPGGALCGCVVCRLVVGPQCTSVLQCGFTVWLTQSPPAGEKQR